MPRTVISLTILIPIPLVAACSADSHGPAGPDSGVDAAAGPDAGAAEEDAGRDPPEPDAEVAPDCDSIATAPVAFESLSGFTASEDFQFDDQGRFVGGDDDGNLVRITRDGDRRLFVPNAGAGGAGMRFLSSGDLVFARVDDGTLYRASPNGGVVAVLSGLVYPNGVEVDLDDQVYVSEQAAGRVRKVDPATGAFTIVARGLSNPNGLSFSPDYETLYCGSFGAGVIYAIRFDAEGYPLSPILFAETPNAPGAEPPQGPTADSIAACSGRQDGAACSVAIDGESIDGTCYTLGRDRYCDTATTSFDPSLEACATSADGDECTVDWGDGVGSAGVCVDYGGFLYCATDSGTVACAGRQADDTCTIEETEGVCVDYGMGYVYCQLPTPAGVACQGLDSGDPCTIVWGPGDEDAGDCADDGFGGLQCTPPQAFVEACDDLIEGDSCSWVNGAGSVVEGQCVEYAGLLSCGVDPWADPFAVACEDLGSGDGCSAEYLGETFGGECVDAWGDGSLYCQAQPDVVAPCAGLAEGDACTVDYWGYPYDSVCVTAEGGALECDVEGFSGGGSGGLDGLEVDACGYVYVTEYAIGKVWRITPDGAAVELLFDPPASWIPNLHWGNGLGGFEKDRLYVANRDEGGLYEVAVGVEGKRRRYP